MRTGLLIRGSHWVGPARLNRPQTCVRILRASDIEVKAPIALASQKTPQNPDGCAVRPGRGGSPTPPAPIVTLAPLAGSDDQDSGLLGNLPSRRPSVESPRRAPAREASAKRAGAHAPPAAPPVEGGAGLEELA